MLFRIDLQNDGQTYREQVVNPRLKHHKYSQSKRQKHPLKNILVGNVKGIPLVATAHRFP